MAQPYYHVGAFARMAKVSIRTLQFYDREGLLKPSHHSESGQRLYVDDDLVALQQILALKVLGLTLVEIKQYLHQGPISLPRMLAKQKTVLLEKRGYLDVVIQAIEKTEHSIQQGRFAWESIIHIMEAIQMEENKDWVKKYFSPEEEQARNDTVKQSYSEEALHSLGQHGAWTEEDQKRVDQQYAWIAQQLTQLRAEGKSPEDPAAQAVVKVYRGLIEQFTQGNPQVEAGLAKFYENFTQLPTGQKPKLYPWDEDENTFLHDAERIFLQREAGKE